MAEEDQPIQITGPAPHILMRQNSAVTSQSKAKQQSRILARTGNPGLRQGGDSRPEDCSRFDGHTHPNSPQVTMPDDRPGNPLSIRHPQQGGAPDLQQ